MPLFDEPIILYKQSIEVIQGVDEQVLSHCPPIRCELELDIFL